MVYPRVGGGTPVKVSGAGWRGGLSPRGRGNQVDAADDGIVRGSIPAWAGEPRPEFPAAPPAEVYPRVGGGTRGNRGTCSISKGLSPRGRGNPHCPGLRGGPPRSIPAWAGEPREEDDNLAEGKVYPRVGGGTFQLGQPAQRLLGLSPRGRGNREPSLPSAPKITVYPRVGGGTHGSLRPEGVAAGLSPRGRGNRQKYAPRLTVLRSIPAWAGEPERGMQIFDAHGVYPRVGGGNHPAEYVHHQVHGLSPRGRGKRVGGDAYPLPVGSIPAWAGETRRQRRRPFRCRVYPRVGGGNWMVLATAWNRPGLSPRGRGKHSRAL